MEGRRVNGEVTKDRQSRDSRKDVHYLKSEYISW